MIKNVPTYASNYEFIVATEVENEYWFYGAYADGDKAQDIAAEIDGIVFMQ